jgi:multicomponent Na+:H+ antiporter subunit G
MNDIAFIIADALVILGVVIMSIGIFGVVWMPDLYTRVHAASKSVFLGVVPILLALMLLGDAAIIFRSILIAIFLLLTTPVAAHAIARAAYQANEPMETPGALDESGHRLPKRPLHPSGGDERPQGDVPGSASGPGRRP